MEKEDCALPITIPDRASTHYVQRTQNKQTKEGGKGAEEETEKKKKGLPGDPPAWTQMLSEKLTYSYPLKKNWPPSG